MRLFLLLSALLAGLTGLVAGGAGQARAGEPVAIAAALSCSVQQGREAAQIQRIAAEPVKRVETCQGIPLSDEPVVSGRRRVDERRIE